MLSVLIVEDSAVVMKILRHIATRTLNFDLVFAGSRKEALQLLATKDNWLAAVVDLNLPDAPNGELVADLLGLGIATIVLTGSVDDNKREKLTRQGIVDYVLKEGRYSYQFAIDMVNRLYRNQSIKVLVAEDSKTTRAYISELLSRQMFQVVEASDGQQALEQISNDKQIQILLTDYNMPNMDGFELVHELRHRQNKTELVIIGLSSAEDRYLSANFIKHGANDFLYKPFSHEEFSCRIIQAVESMERLADLKLMAYSDVLTGISNRRLLIDKGRKLLNQALDQNTPLALALLDIDHFKDINDTYGHDVGDEVLISFAQTLTNSFGRFLVARTGGEEFCIVMPGLTADKATQLINLVRVQVESEFVLTTAGDISFSFSGGVVQTPAENIEDLMKNADVLLYRAKDAGRNMVLGA